MDYRTVLGGGILFNPYEEMWNFQRFRPLIQEQMRKWRLNKLNPLNLCPTSLVFWFIIPPFKAIGISILGLKEIAVYWRQQIEPNETTFLMFKIQQFELPMPLTLLIAFSLFGLTIADAVNTLLQTVREESVNELDKVEKTVNGLSSSVIDFNERVKEVIKEEEQQTLLKQITPFRLTPRMSIFFPVYDNHTSIGFLTIDFAHTEFSVKQSLEPNECILSVFRFMDFHSPFPLQVGVIALSMGIFFVGNIYKYGQSMREEVLSEVKRALK